MLAGLKQQPSCAPAGTKANHPYLSFHSSFLVSLVGSEVPGVTSHLTALLQQKKGNSSAKFGSHILREDKIGSE